MAIPLGATATNPQTGQRVVLTEKGWVALSSPQMALPQADQKSMEDLQQQAQDTQFLDQKARQFMQTMDPRKASPGQPARGSFATGPALTPGFDVPFTDAEVPNPVHALVNARDPRLGTLESITNQAFVHLRPQGSGPLRSYEAEPFKQAFPNPTNYGRTNEEIAARIHQDALIASQKLAFIDDFIRSGKGDYAQANDVWQRLFAGGGQGQSPQGAPQQPPPLPPPMAMVSNPQSPIGASPAPGVPPPPPDQQTPQQQAILNWTPDKGLHP